MDIRVVREDFTGQSTIGDLLIDDKWFSYVLEDTVRSPAVKVPGQTAIPTGKYEVIIDKSARFKRMLPHILNVPDFTGIRIHAGNTAKDTEGCLLLGATKAKDFIGKSVITFNRFFLKLQEGLKQGKVYITIT
ncbi:MAG: DUF5675 family protein [Ignavibacteria bacterium]|nr:DUF5675 family protein [Ignavibacteria bacterium]